MNKQEWNLPEMLKQQRTGEEQALKAALREKVESIKHAYSKEVNGKQLPFLKKDEGLCIAVEDMVNLLIKQLNFVLEENQTLKQEYNLLYQQQSQTQEKYINQIVEANELRFEKMKQSKELAFTFKD